MNLGQVLASAQTQLKQAGIGSPRLDVLILLEDTLHRERSWLLAHPETQLSPTQKQQFDRKLARRARHIPLSYVRGHTEFYGRRFKVNRHTLEPRPESETMIELLTKLALPPNPALADVGTGSGALGITAALEITDSQVDLYDISASALAVAKHNTHMHELRLHCRKMNLLSRPLRQYDIILANLPYVPTTWKINQAAMSEPKLAIFGGNDGLDVYRQLFTQLTRHTWLPKYVLCESLPPQHEKLVEIAKQAGFGLHKSQDFIQIFAPVKNT